MNTWIEKPRKRYRLREKINGDKITVIKDLGIWKLTAQDCLKDYRRARINGFTANLKSANIMADVQEFLKARQEGREVQPSKTLQEAAESWIIDVPRDPGTVALLRDTIRLFLKHSEIQLLSDMSKDVIDGWRSAMEKGTLTWMRKRKDGESPAYPYAKATIYIHMRNLRSFIRYCSDREWVSVKMVRWIKTQKVPSTRRFLTRTEAARLIKAARVEVFEQRGGGANRTAPHIERQVLKESVKHPLFGKLKMSKHLAAKGTPVYPTTVRQIWGRYAMVTPEQRRLLSRRKRLPQESQRPTARVRNKKANNRLRKILLFGFYTGERAGEVLRGRWNHVSRQEIFKRLPSGAIRSYTIYSQFIPKAKKHKQRTVAWHPRLSRIMGAARRMGKNLPLFPGWTEGNLGKMRRKAVERAGLSRARYHDLRHSFVRNYLKSGAGSIGQLREQTGHEDLASLDPYAHFANQDIAATIGDMRIS